MPINIEHPTGHMVKVNRHIGCCRGNQIQWSNHIKSKGSPSQVRAHYSEYKGDISVVEFGTTDDNFDHVDLLASMDVSDILSHTRPPMRTETPQ